MGTNTSWEENGGRPVEERSITEKERVVLENECRHQAGRIVALGVSLRKRH
jgi:hypothetical protein